MNHAADIVTRGRHRLRGTFLESLDECFICLDLFGVSVQRCEFEGGSFGWRARLDGYMMHFYHPRLGTPVAVRETTPRPMDP